jgi:hypothetical protein
MSQKKESDSTIPVKITWIFRNKNIFLSNRTIKNVQGRLQEKPLSKTLSKEEK